MKTKQDSIFSSKTLTYFLQLAETMNYTQAAQILGITQPALTQQIKKLEKTVGAELFYSVGKKLRLTDAGYTMLDATKNIYEVLNKATDEIQQSTSATQGSISIGILASTEDSVLENFAIQSYRKSRHPNRFHMLTRKKFGTASRTTTSIWQSCICLTIQLSGNLMNPKIVSGDLLFVHHDEALSSVNGLSMPTRWIVHGSCIRLITI